MTACSGRSSLLMSRTNTAVLVIDIQEKLVPLIAGHQVVCWNAGRLIDGAILLGLPIHVSEQYPQGLGHTVADLRKRLPVATVKRMFSCRECTPLISGLIPAGIENVLICGIETHVCVQQTALDLVAAGLSVYLAVDAVGSRFAIDHSTALGRMQSAGVSLTTAESALFEWCETSASDEFKSVSNLVRQTPPDFGS